MKIDVDGSGEIDYDEFIGAIVKNKIKNYLWKCNSTFIKSPISNWISWCKSRA